MRIGIVGAGRVGLSLGKYFSAVAQTTISGYYSRTLKSAQEGAEFTGSTVFTSLHDILDMSDTLLITTPDGEIATVWDGIMKEWEQNQYQHKIVCHCSGSLSSEIFSEHKKTAISVCSMHPMYAFYHKYESYQQLHHVFFTMEGDRTAVEAMTALLRAAGNPYAVIDSMAKVRYHCAAAMASNQVAALISCSLHMLQECGFTQETARQMLGVLAVDNMKNVFEKGPAQALTGPVERNDVATVQAHLQCLEPDLRQLYALLAEEQLRLVKQKYPGRDVDSMQTLLEQMKEREDRI